MRLAFFNASRDFERHDGGGQICCSLGAPEHDNGTDRQRRDIKRRGSRRGVRERERQTPEMRHGVEQLLEVPTY